MAKCSLNNLTHDQYYDFLIAQKMTPTQILASQFQKLLDLADYNKLTLEDKKFKFPRKTTQYDTEQLIKMLKDFCRQIRDFLQVAELKNEQAKKTADERTTESKRIKRMAKALETVSILISLSFFNIEDHQIQLTDINVAARKKADKKELAFWSSYMMSPQKNTTDSQNYQGYPGTPSDSQRRGKFNNNNLPKFEILDDERSSSDENDDFKLDSNTGQSSSYLEPPVVADNNEIKQETTAPFAQVLADSAIDQIKQNSDAANQVAPLSPKIMQNVNATEISRFPTPKNGKRTVIEYSDGTAKIITNPQPAVILKMGPPPPPPPPPAINNKAKDNTPIKTIEIIGKDTESHVTPSSLVLQYENRSKINLVFLSINQETKETIKKVFNIASELSENLREQLIDQNGDVVAKVITQNEAAYNRFMTGKNKTEVVCEINPDLFQIIFARWESKKEVKDVFNPQALLQQEMKNILRNRIPVSPSKMKKLEEQKKSTVNSPFKKDFRFSSFRLRNVGNNVGADNPAPTQPAFGPHILKKRTDNPVINKEKTENNNLSVSSHPGQPSNGMKF